MDSLQDTLLPKFARKPFLLWLGAGVLVLNLFVALMGGLFARKSLRNQQGQAIATAQNLAQVLDHYVADTFGKADRAVLAVKDEAERAAADPGRLRGLNAFIRRQHERVPGLVAIRTANVQGLIEYGSGPAAGVDVSLADRDYFRRLREDPGVAVQISPPLVGRISREWRIILARRLERPDHSFGGIVYAVIALDQFGKAFSDLDVGPHGSVALRGLDLGLIARHPEPVSAGTDVGQTFVSPEFTAFARSGQSTGIFHARTPFDRIQRTFAIRRVSGWPFYILVGLADQDYLAGWRRDGFQELLEVLLFTSLTLVASWLLYRAWIRQEAAQAHLETLLAEVKTLGGMLPICSHCKKIRDDKGYWNQIEAYLNEHTDAEFTHGICPDCAREVFPRRAGKTPES